MDYLISILLLLPCASARTSARTAAPDAYPTLVQLRRNAYPVYANAGDLSEEYEPYAVAVLPSHAPLQLLQLVSPTAYRPKLRRPVKRPRPETDLYAYDTSQVEDAYEPYTEHVYEAETQPKHSKAKDSYEDEASSVIVYARPNKHGGFSYRKPAVSTAAPRLRTADHEPVIIRIHKYRVIH